MNLLKTDTLYIIEKVLQVGSTSEKAVPLEEIVPLLQTLLWIVFVGYCIYFFKDQIILLREAVSLRLKDGSAIKLGSFELGEIRKEINTVKDNLQATNDRISRLFITTMGADLFTNLAKMSSGNFGKFHKTKGLVRELYYLRDLGYIQVPSITDIPEAGEQLSEYVKVTSVGDEFVKLRKENFNRMKSMAHTARSTPASV